MKLEEYQKLLVLQLITDDALDEIQQAKKNYENNKIDKEFENTQLFKPITDSNKELINRLEKKNRSQ